MKVTANVKMNPHRFLHREAGSVFILCIDVISSDKRKLFEFPKYGRS